MDRRDRTAFGVPPGQCRMCIPERQHYGQGDEHLFPVVWEPLSAHPHWEPASWVAIHGRGPPLVFCRLCGTIWSTGWDRHNACYAIAALPPGIDAVLRTDGHLEDVLRLVAADQPETVGLIDGYLGAAPFDGSVAVRHLVSILARSPLSPPTAHHMMAHFRSVIMGRERGVIDVPTLEPLVGLFDREDVWGDRFATARTKSATRTLLDDIVLAGILRPSLAHRERLRTRDVDRAALLAMSGPWNRLARAFRVLERATEEKASGPAMEAVVDAWDVSLTWDERPTPGQMRVLENALRATTELAAGAAETDRWWRISNDISGLLLSLKTNRPAARASRWPTERRNDMVERRDEDA